MPASEAVQLGLPRISAAAKPTPMPGRLIASGMIWWSKSMNVMTISAHENAKVEQGVRGRVPSAQTVATAAHPPSSSTSG